MIIRDSKNQPVGNHSPSLNGLQDSQNIEDPSGYPAVVRGSLSDINVDFNKFKSTYDQELINIKLD